MQAIDSSIDNCQAGVGLHLNMNELGACDVAAQDVSVSCVAKGDHGVITQAAQLTSNKELACIASRRLVSTHQLASANAFRTLLHSEVRLLR